MSTTIIGIDKLYFAPMKDEQLETYYKPVQIGYVQEFSIEPEQESVSQYGDNRAIETASAMGAITGTLTLTGIRPDREALILGHQFDETTNAVLKKANTIAPMGAVLYRRLKADGTYRYKVLYKGRFGLPKEETTTREDKIEFQGSEFTINFVPRLKDEFYEFQVDPPKDKSKEWEDGFFKGVIEPKLPAIIPTPLTDLPPGIKDAELIPATTELPA